MRNDEIYDDQGYMVVLSIIRDEDWEKMKRKERQRCDKLTLSGYMPIGNTNTFYRDAGIVGDGCRMKQTFFHG